MDLQNFWQKLSEKNQINTASINIKNSLLVQLAKEALIDANIDENSYTNLRISVTINDCRINQSDQHLSQLLASLGLDNSHHNSHHFTKRLGEGINIAGEQLQSKQADIALTIIIDSQSAAVLVLKRQAEVTETKEHIYAVPLLLHEEQLNEDETGYQTLNHIYSQKEFQGKSVELLSISAPSSLNVQSYINNLSKCLSHSTKAWCSLRTSIVDEQSRSINVIMPLIETILSLQQRVIVPTISSEIQPDSPFYLNTALRPWFYPQIHNQLALLNPDITDQINPINLRRAALHCIDLDGQSCHLLLEEHPDVNEIKSQDFKTIWESEVFAFYAADKQELFNYAQAIKKFLSKHKDSNLKDLAFTVNNWSQNQLSGARESSIPTKQPIRAAFVSTSIDDIHSKLDQLLQYCLTAKYSDDLYCNDHSAIGNEISQGKLAFILPGLGAAYPDMLTELCLHFPIVRAIFDFVDYLAVSANSRLKPSERVFPHRGQFSKPSTESAASLAMMDSAVITVLIAEWAIFTVLLNLGISPDILLGCSTGEFAALTMSGAINIISAAPLFYHLSTGISKALPFNRLVNLRSLKINAAFTDVEKYLTQYEGKVHLSADLSDKQLLVTGDKDSINTLTKTLEENNISADFLPFAIPYHTSLVVDIVSPQNPDVLALQIFQPLIESWSCSLANKYPSDPEAIRKISTELFSKPILFRNSIEALYRKGVRKFVEVGPRGNLAPIISETLKSNPHISIAANRADLSAITQLNHTLAALFINDVYMDFSFLYMRRAPVSLPISEYLVDNTPDYQTPLLSIEDFRNQLMQLEQQTIALLQSNRHMPLPAQNYLSEEISLPEIFSRSGSEPFLGMICRQILDDQLDSNTIPEYTDSVLLPSETETFQSFQQLAKRRQWLAGRIAVKEAVRSLLHKILGIHLANHDIEIGVQPSGKIFVSKIHTDYPVPVISLTHKHNRVIAIAADSSIYSAVGIDLESLDPTDDDLAALVFSPQEQRYFQNLPSEERNANFKKLWAAKEAAAKVLGLGLPNYLKNLSIVETNKDITHFSIEAATKSTATVERFISEPGTVQTIELGTSKLSAYVTSSENMVLAISFFPVR